MKKENSSKSNKTKSKQKTSKLQKLAVFGRKKSQTKSSVKPKQTNVAAAEEKVVKPRKPRTTKTQTAAKKVEKPKETMLAEPQKLPKVEFYEVLMDKEPRSIIEIILANVIVFFAVFVSTFIPVLNLGLPIFVFIYFEVGLYLFVYKKECGRDFKYEDLFVSLKKLPKIFCAFIIKKFLSMLWGLLLIVPGIVCLLDYSFVCLILSESPNLDVRGAMMLSKELVKGHRLNIFFYFAIALASICVSMSLMFFVIMLFDIFLAVPVAVYIVFVLMAGIFAFIVLFCPIVELAVVDNYILAKNDKAKSTLSNQNAQ